MMMIRLAAMILLGIWLLTALPGWSEEAPARPAEDASAQNTESDEESADEGGEAPPADGEAAPAANVPEPAVDSGRTASPEGGLRETVTETLRDFTPSEEIDVDKPVDFPTNI